MRLSPRYQYIVLCEDAQMKSFIMSFLLAERIPRGKMRFKAVPAGVGSGESFVIKNYPMEVMYLQKNNFNRIVLVVCVDADRDNFDEKEQKLKKELSKHNETCGIKRLERPIMLWVPRRQIENWIHYLRNEDTNEEKDYRHTGKPERCKEEAERMVALFQGENVVDYELLPSIIRAKNEYERICKIQDDRP